MNILSNRLERHFSTAYLSHVYFESVRCEGHAGEGLVGVLVLPGLPVLPDVAEADQEHDALRLPRAHAAETLGERGAVHQGALGAVTEVDGHLSIVMRSLSLAKDCPGS